MYYFLSKLIPSLANDSQIYKESQKIIVILATLILLDNYLSNLDGLHFHPRHNIPTPSNYNGRALSIDDLDLKATDELFSNSCEFLPENVGPVPVILFAFGRSGSSITWNIMSNLTGYENVAPEKVKTKDQFLDQIVDDPKTTHDWARKTLCVIQNRKYKESGYETGSGIAGFQWKPGPMSLDHEYGVETLKRISEQQKSNPSVRVVVLTRNFLDRRYSNLKHKQSKKIDGVENKIPDHCQVGDDECVKMHFKNEMNILFPTGHHLLNQLDTSLITHEKLVRLLRELNIEHVEVTYEKLYNSESAEEWMRILKHLGIGPLVGLTIEEVTRAMGLSKTNQGNKSQIVRNFEDVYETLKGTTYEELLTTWM